MEDAGQGVDPRILAAAEDLDRQRQADAAGGAPGAGTPPPAPVPLERELAGMFAMIGVGAGQFLPSVKLVLDDQACQQLGAALAPVARKYGLEKHLAGFGWREELQALMVCVPIGFAIAAAVKHDLAQYKAAAAGEPAAAAGSSSSSSAASSSAAGAGGQDKPPMLQPVKT